MSAAATLARGRALAETLMVDTCTVKRITGQTTNPATGVVNPIYTTIYTGKCKLQDAGGGVQGRQQEVGEAELVVLRREVHLPLATSATVRSGDQITITACANDAAMVGRVFVVRDEFGKTFATARRIQVDEVTS